MPIFDSRERTSKEAGSSSIPQFAYLNSSARPEAGRVREALEDFITRFPEAHRGALIARLRSELDEVHHSAFFELALHELLLRSGHQIEEIEPAIPGSSLAELVEVDAELFCEILKGHCVLGRPSELGLAKDGGVALVLQPLQRLRRNEHGDRFARPRHRHGPVRVAQLRQRVVELRLLGLSQAHRRPPGG